MIYETQTIYEDGAGQAIANNGVFTFDTPINLDGVVDAAIAVEYTHAAAFAAAGTLALLGAFSMQLDPEEYSDTMNPLAIFPVAQVPFQAGTLKRAVEVFPVYPVPLCKVTLKNNGLGQSITIKSIKVVTRKGE